MRLKLCSGLMFSTTCVLLCFGAGWLFLMPRFPGESYFTLERLFSGLGSTLLGLALLCGAGWAWSASDKTSASVAIKRSFSFAVGLIGLFWLVLMIIGGIRQG
jgi:hypothetical protein